MGVRRHSDQAPRWGFQHEFRVRCPRCDSQAVVLPRDGSARLTCPQCALIREWDALWHALGPDGRPRVLERSRHTGGWIDPATGRTARGDIERYYDRDPYFGTVLWLRAECCGGHVLWAFNREHLDHLDSFIGAKLRERPHDNPAEPWAPLSWKLPTWMKAAKHREELLTTIERMRSTL